MHTWMQGSLSKEEEDMLGRVEGGEQLLASEKAAWVKLLQVRTARGTAWHALGPVLSQAAHTHLPLTNTKHPLSISAAHMPPRTYI